jgi:spore coat protein U-like protein
MAGWSMKRKFSLILLLLSLLTSLSYADDNDCELTLTLNDQVWEGGGGNLYNPYDSVEYEQIVNFDDEGDCDYFITFSKGDNGSGVNKRRLETNSKELKYQLYRDSGKTHVLKDDPSKKNNVLSSSHSDSDLSPKTLSFYWQMKKEQVKEPGTYTDTVELEVYEGKAGKDNDMIAGPFSLNLRTEVPAALFLSIVDTGSQFNDSDISQQLDFNELEEGENLSFDLRVKGNTGYNVSMTSENNSKMILSGAMGSSVPYSVKVKGSTKDLSGGGSVVVANVNKKTKKDGDKFSVEITVGSLSDADPGVYLDTIDVEVSAE